MSSELLGGKTFGIISGVTLTLLVLMLWQALLGWENSRIKDVLRQQADGASSAVDQFIYSEVAALERMSQRMSQRWSISGGISREQWDYDAKAYIEDMPVFQAIEWVDKDFYVRWIVPLEGNETAQDLNLAFDATRLRALVAAREKGATTVTRTVDLVQGGQGFLIYSPIFTAAGFNGFVLGVVRVDRLVPHLLDFQQLNERFHIKVFDGDKLIWSSSDQIDELEGFVETVDLTLKNVQWRAEFYPKFDYLKELKSVLPDVVLAAGIVLILLFQGVLFFFFSARKANQKILDKETQLEQVNQALYQAEQRYRAINYLMPVGVLLVNSRGVIVEANQQACSIFNYPQEILLGLNVDQLVPDMQRYGHKGLRESYGSDSRTRRMAGEKSDLMGQTRDARLVPVEVGLSPIEIGGERFVVASIIDMTERKRMMQDLQERNLQMDTAIEKLRHSNEQLERFAFVCSHDLQEPVRMVLSFSQLLERRLGPGLDDKSREYLDFMTDGAKRARGMITDILAFCRLDQQMQAKEKVSLAETCQQVRESLRELLEERQANFTWDEATLPQVTASSSQVFQLFLNLVTNGLKFNHSEYPQVEVTAEENSDYWIISVQDNGIGIEEKYQEQIFTVFKRLSTKTEFPGTGIGLAICKKVAEHHGADIRLASVPGLGSRFMIFWPKPECAEPDVLKDNND